MASELARLYLREPLGPEVICEILYEARLKGEYGADLGDTEGERPVIEQGVRESWDGS